MRPEKHHFLTIFSLVLLLFPLINSIPPAAAKTDDKETAEKIKLFKSDYEFPKNNTAARIKAFDRLNGVDHPKLIKLLADEIIPAEIQKDDPLVVECIVGTLGRFKDDETVVELAKQSEKKPVPVRLILIRGMAGIKHPEVIKQLIKFIGEEKQPAVQMAAIEALIDDLPPEATAAILQALGTPEWPVRAAAVNYLANFKPQDDVTKEIVLTALRKQKEKETGRLKDDIIKITNLISQSKTSVAPSLTGPDNIGTDTIAQFYGLTINSNNVIFVVDTSGSMLQPANEKQKRIDVLREELIKAVENLSPKAEFNIITFNNQAVIWEPNMVSVTQYRSKALDWIKREVKTLDPSQPWGNTNLYSGLDLAFKLAQNIPSGRTKPTRAVPTGYVNTKGADTIFLMSDGFPDMGDYIKGSDILTAVRSLNQTLQIRINTIAVGADPKTETGGLLKKLAEQNNGTCVFK